MAQCGEQVLGHSWVHTAPLTSQQIKTLTTRPATFFSFTNNMNPTGTDNLTGFPVNSGGNGGGFAVPMTSFAPQQLPINQITQIGLTYGTGYFSQQSAAFQKSVFLR